MGCEAHAGLQGLAAGVLQGSAHGDGRPGGDDVDDGLGRAARVRACYEVPARCGTRSPPSPGSRAETPGGRRPSTSVQGSVPSSRTAASRWSTCPAAPASPTTSTPTVATGRAGRLAGLVRARRGRHERRARDRGRPADVEKRIAPPAPTRAATRPRSGWSWSPSCSRPPTSGCSPTSGSPTSARTGTRRPRPRPPSAPTSGCAGTSSAACRATRRPRSRRTPTSCTRSTGPSWSAAWPGAPSVDRRRAAPGQPRPAGQRPRAGADPDELAALAAAVDGAEHLALRGLMAVAPLGADPAPAFERLAEIRAGFLGGVPGGDLALGGHERRPGARDRGRRDTRACRLRGPRIEASGPVAFKAESAAPARSPDPEGRQS